MGRVTLARVDARLIHGQVATQLSQGSDVDAIFAVDTHTANDPFTKNIIIGAGEKTGNKIRVLKDDGAVRYWNDRQYDNYKVLLITKTIEQIYEIVKNGVPIKKLNLGGVPQRPGYTPIIKEVGVTKEQMEMLKDMRDNYGVEDIFFQAIPSSKKVSLDAALKMMGL